MTTRQTVADKLRDLATGLESRSEDSTGARLYRLTQEAIDVIRAAADELDNACCQGEYEHNDDCPEMTLPTDKKGETKPQPLDMRCGFECECSPICKTRCDRPTLHKGGHSYDNYPLTEHVSMLDKLPPNPTEL